MKTNSTILFTLLISLSIIAFSSKTMAQSLQNTSWDFYNDSTNVFAVSGTFAVDTFLFGQGASLTPIATYTDSASIFSIQDINPNQCGTGVGSYSYTISSGVFDTLRFTIITEPCQIRGAFFGEVYGTRLPVSLLEAKQNKTRLSVYPNPSSGEFQLELTEKLIGSRAIVRDMSGRIVEDFRINNTSQQINIDGPKGMYFLQIDRPNSPLIKKLIVQ